MHWILQYWLEALFALALGALTVACRTLWKKSKQEHARYESVQEGLKALLRNSLISTYHEYVDRGYIPIYAMETVEAMYLAYSGLGGNGTVTKLYKELRELPSVTPE